MDVTLTRRIIPAAEKKDFKPLRIEMLISHLPNLPAAFELVPRLLLLLDDPEAGCDDLADIIRIDPGLTADVLRIANTAAYRGSERTGSLSEAIMRIGLREICRVVLEIVTSPALQTSDASAIHGVDLWQHSLATAVAAQTLARYRSKEDPEVVFSAALLHDVGKTILAQAAGADYSMLLEICAEMGRSVHAAERDAFRIDHLQAAGILLKAWKFPENVIAGVVHHHAPLEARPNHQAIAALIYAGNILA